MKKLAIPAVFLAYITLVAIGVPEFGPIYSPWYLSLLSVLFVGAYLEIARGSVAISISTVFVVTLLFPLAVLTLIGWPTYRSWSVMANAFASTFIEHGQFWGLEMLFPLVAGIATAASIYCWRANKARTPDARQQPRTG